VGLVLGGLGTRLELSYERLDELQLAVTTVLDTLAADGEVTVDAAFDERELVIRIGPCEAPAATSVVAGHVLEQLADASRVATDDDRDWVELTFARAGVR